MNEKKVLCGANSFTEKYYFNPEFNGLPETIKKELQIMCVLFTADVGGALFLEFDEEGNLLLTVTRDEEDFLFDEIGSGLKVKQIQQEKRDLLESLELYYRTFYLGEEFDA
ncbi:MAG: hypothetical protein IKU83_04145 [Lachnospiraceae bacterium]|nr:hypothetical protein [Lachnospiraceae bacterium]